MEEKDYKDVERIILREKDNSDSNIFSKYNIFVFREGLKPEINTFDTKSECINFAGDIIESKYDSVEEAEEKNKEDKFIMSYTPTDENVELDNVVMAYLTARLENPKIEISPSVVDSIMTGNINTKSDDDDLSFAEEKPRFKKLKRVGAITAVGVILAGSIAPVVVNIAKSNDAQKIDDLEKEDYSNLSIEQLLKKMEDGSLAKKEYSKALEFCNNFNNLTKQPNNFYLESDKENHLTISAEEALYTSIVLNNYNSDELMQIFGNKTLNYEEVMKAYNSVCEKIRIYNMNAKIPSGLDSLMNKPALYRNAENAVIEYNKDNTKEKSDRVILTCVNNTIAYNDDKDVNAAVINMANMPIKGYIEANANNNESLKYNGLFGENIIKAGESLNNIAAINDYSSKIKTQVQSNIDEYNSMLAAKLSVSKGELVKALKNNGNIELANEVESSSNIEDLESKINSNGAEFIRLYDDYKTAYEGLNPSGISSNIIINKINEKVLDGSTCNLRMLKEHRIRTGKTKEKEVTTPSDNNYNENSYDYNDDYDNNTYDYVDDEIVDNDFNDNTNDYIEGDEPTDIAQDNFDYTEEAYNDVEDYVNTPGAYKYDGVLNAHFGGETTDEEELERRSQDIEQMTPFQLWVAMIMDNNEINPETDEQIKEARSNAIEGKNETYEKAWDDKLTEVLGEADNNAKERIAELERDYQNNQDSVDDLNNNDATVLPSSTYEEDINNYDSEVNYVEEESMAEDNLGYAQIATDDEVETEDFDNYGGYAFTK